MAHGKIEIDKALDAIRSLAGPIPTPAESRMSDVMEQLQKALWDEAERIARVDGRPTITPFHVNKAVIACLYKSPIDKIRDLLECSDEDGELPADDDDDSWLDDEDEDEWDDEED